MTDATTLQRRRARIASALEGRPILLAAGAPRVRNYRAWTYPFRATSHFLYLTARSLAGAALWLEGDQAVLFVEPESEAHALWSGPSTPWDELQAAIGVQAVRPLPELDSVIGMGRAFQIATIPPQEETTARWLQGLLGREVRAHSGSDLPDGSLDARLADALIEARLHHDAAACAQLRAAAIVTAAAHHEGRVISKRGSGRTEAEVRAAMECAITQCAMSLAYAPIVTVHGEVLHNENHSGTLRPGDLLLADVGAETAEGWASDVTRVWPVSGELSSTQRILYELVLHVQRAAIEQVKPGASYRTIHHHARRALVTGLVEIGILRGNPEDLDGRGAGDLFFPHGVGHLLGLDVHDMEDLGDRAGYARGCTRSDRFGECYLRLDRELEPGMALTIEPGFYQVPAILKDPKRTGSLDDAIDWSTLEHFADVRGIRLEDDVLVTEAGCEVLTAAIPKEIS